ncbi:hypothetical protein, partial [Streptococcus pneumoniae]|uniref:hypothetical protein n=1 Tax=Streptococcus pneumoniae TaxID=1313 RepID=UPI001C5AFF5C
NSSTTLIERIKPTVSKMEIIANKKASRSQSLATPSVRLVARKTFQKILPFETFSCTYFIKKGVQIQ